MGRPCGDCSHRSRNKTTPFPPTPTPTLSPPEQTKSSASSSRFVSLRSGTAAVFLGRLRLSSTGCSEGRREADVDCRMARGEGGSSRLPRDRRPAAAENDDRRAKARPAHWKRKRKRYVWLLRLGPQKHQRQFTPEGGRSRETLRACDALRDDRSVDRRERRGVDVPASLWGCFDGQRDVGKRCGQRDEGEETRVRSEYSSSCQHPPGRHGHPCPCSRA